MKLFKAAYLFAVALGCAIASMFFDDETASEMYLRITKRGVSK